MTQVDPDPDDEEFPDDEDATPFDEDDDDGDDGDVEYVESVTIVEPEDPPKGAGGSMTYRP